jgi:DNA-binding NarL/FixJ family response regulator
LFVVQVKDGLHRLDLGGPVMRALDAGAHGYLVARSVYELGEAIVHAATAGGQALASEAIALPASADEQLDDVLDAIIRDRLRERDTRVY